jgi:hypothetical protein
VKQEYSGCVPCSGFMGRTNYGVEFDVHQNGVNITSPRSCLCSMEGQIITVLVVAAPTEDACVYDVMLYDHYRSVITAEARRRYVRGHYYKERMLLQAQTTEAAFDQAALVAKRAAVKLSTKDAGQKTPLLFQGNRVFRGRQQMYGYYPYSGRQF